jgi:flagellar assembly protein FliH
MAKSKLIGEFGEEGSPLSAFNVSKAMAKAKEAAFILKTGESKIGDQPFRKVSWNEVAPLVDLTSEEELKSIADSDVGQGSADTDSDVNIDGEEGNSEQTLVENDGWDEALQSADGALQDLAAPVGDTPQDEILVGDGAAPVQAEPLSLTPDIPSPAVIDEAQKEEIREEAYNEGFSAGKAMTESAREAELDGRIADLDRVITALSDPNLLDTEMLSLQIKQSVLSMAKARAGSQIDNFPEPFIGRLETMLRNVQHMSGKRELFVSEADLAVIKAGLPAHKDLAMITMHVDSSFDRGDVKLRVGGGEITDLYEELTPSEVPAIVSPEGADASIGDVHEPSGVADLETSDGEGGEIAPEVTEVAATQDVTLEAGVTPVPDHTPDGVPLIVSQETAPAEDLVVSDDVVLSEGLLVSDEVIVSDDTAAPHEVDLKND